MGVEKKGIIGIVFIALFSVILFSPFISSQVDNVIDLGAGTIRLSVADNFVDLDDTPTSYSGSDGLCVIVNATTGALFFGSCSNATGAGDITGVQGDTYIINGSDTGAVNLVFNETHLNLSIDARAASADTNASTECAGDEVLLGNTSCYSVASISGTNYFDLASDWIENTTTSGLNISNLIVQDSFMTTNNNFTWNMVDDGTNLILNASSVAGNNYWGAQTDGAFIQLYSNPNAGNGYLLFTITETQGANTFLNFYEGGTGHNRFWDSGSLRVGGNASHLCSNLTTDVDCDTPTTGADLVVQDDGWFGGKLFSYDWSNVSLTESQISDLSHTGNNEITLTEANITDLDHIGNEEITLLEANITDLSHIGNNEITLLEANITDLSHIGNNEITLLEANITDLDHIGNEEITLLEANITDLKDYVEDAGDTMTGSLNISANLSINNGAGSESFFYDNGTCTIWERGSNQIALCD